MAVQALGADGLAEGSTVLQRSSGMLYGAIGVYSSYHPHPLPSRAAGFLHSVCKPMPQHSFASSPSSLSLLRLGH